MDAHIKEGQLYVQHQKFGKVGAENKTNTIVGVNYIKWKLLY